MGIFLKQNDFGVLFPEPVDSHKQVKQVEPSPASKLKDLSAQGDLAGKVEIETTDGTPNIAGSRCSVLKTDFSCKAEPGDVPSQ